MSLSLKPARSVCFTEPSSPDKRGGSEVTATPSNRKRNKNRDWTAGATRAHMVLHEQLKYELMKRERRLPVLTKNKTNWDTVVHASPIEDPADSSGWPVTVSRLELPSERLEPQPGCKRPRIQMASPFVVDGVLSSAECEVLKRASSAVGYMTADDLARLQFPEEYFPPRAKVNTARINIVEDAALASILWNRIRHIIEDHQATVLMGPTPLAAPENSAPAELRAAGVCPLMRLLKYEPGQQFLPHADSRDYAGSMDGKEGLYRSSVTVAVYLNGNEEFSGGSLRFVKAPRLEPPTSPGSTGLVKIFDQHSPPAFIPGKAGRVVLFDHDEWHEGSPVLSGAKYMIQTSVLYRLVGDP